ncbi:MAG: DUF2637 domain-containing protein [Homoserinimonas sp.]
MSSSTVMNVAAIPRILTGTRLDPRSSTGFSLLVLCTVLIVGAAATAASFSGQMALARWALLVGVVAYAVPIVIDGSIAVFTLAAVLQRSRGDSTIVSWSFVGLFTAVSVAGNALHVVSESPEADPVRVIGGASIAGLMPVSMWLVVHVLINLLVQKPEFSPEQLKALELEAFHEYQGELSRRAAEAEEDRRRAAEVRALEQQKAARWAEWERVRDLPEASQPGTAEREFAEKMINSTYYGEAKQNSKEVARLLGISYKRVLYAVENHEASDELGDDTWDLKK